MSSPDTTNRPLPTEGPKAGGDEFDDLFDYDAGIDDPFSENYQAPATNNTNGGTSKSTEAGSKSKAGADLGLDEEVDIKKKLRAPRVKLDEHRLLSANGIPKLRKRAKDLKFKGKGHEYSDASRLLAFYQLWLDDLFPKARFLDALAMVEKAGHKKIIQAARIEWINEGKPHISVHEESLFDDPALPPRDLGDHNRTVPTEAPIFEKRASDRPKTSLADVNADMDMDDLYNATPRPNRLKPIESYSQEAHSQDSLFDGGGSIFGPAKTVGLEDDEPLADDLDALLAEEAMQTVQPTPVAVKVTARAPQEDNFDDEMEAMAEMEGLW